MDWRKEILRITLGFALFLLFYFFPAPERFLKGIQEGVLLVYWYAREHGGEARQWFESSYFGLSNSPSAFSGGIIAGFLLGRLGQEGFILLNR